MKESFRLRRIAGIPVGLNWSLVLIAWLLVASLAGTVLPLAAPGWGTGAYVIAGIIAAIGFFASILAHELGHAVVARRHDIGVEGITLWLLGGVAKLQKEPPTARAELEVAAAGPAVSVALAVAFYGLHLGLDAAGFALVAATIGWLALINVLLAVFNLVPAAPLDGGRILAGGLWLWHGDRDRAKWTATSAGRGFGALLVAFSVWLLLSGGGFLIGPLLIGMFVLSAANQERAHLGLRRRLGDRRVRHAMTPYPIAIDLSVYGRGDTDRRTIHPDTRLIELLGTIDPREGEIPVVDDHRWVVGVVSAHHLLRAMHDGSESVAS